MSIEDAVAFNEAFGTWLPSDPPKSTLAVEMLRAIYKTHKERGVHKDGVFWEVYLTNGQAELIESMFEVEQ